MDKIAKALKKLNPTQRKQFKKILLQIQAGQYSRLDVQQLKGHTDMYRVRKGSMRIIFQVKKEGVITILTLEKRSDITYKRL